MSFRKRNVAVNRVPVAGSEEASNATSSQPSTAAVNSASTAVASHPGTRPSPLTSHQTTSTGTPSLDKLLGLGAGLALGSSLLIQEDGSTDFASALLRAFAAEGVCQGQQVIVVAPKGWSSGLPGIAEERRSSRSGKERGAEEDVGERMKIAWRYEKLGNQVERERRGITGSETSAGPGGSATQAPFCHTFDLAKRLEPPPGSLPVIHVQPSGSISNPVPPFQPIIAALQQALSTSQTTTIRLVLPTLLSPLLYSPTASLPNHLIPFLHTLRSLIKQHPTRLVTLTSWSLSLYPRPHILTRYAEHLTDGIITLQPFPHSFSVDAMEQPAPDSQKTKGTSAADDEKTQGLLQVLRLPVLTERGISVGTGEDMAFAVSRRKFVIRPFHLPPLLESEPLDTAGHGHDHGGEGSKEGATAKVDAKALDF